MAGTSQTTFSIILREWDNCILIHISLKFVNKGPIDNSTLSIALTPEMQQAKCPN